MYRGNFDGVSKQYVLLTKLLFVFSQSWHFIFLAVLKSIAGVLTAFQHNVFCLVQLFLAVQNPGISFSPRTKIYRGSLCGVWQHCFLTIQTLLGCSKSWNFMFPPGEKSIVGVFAALGNIVFYRFKRCLAVQNPRISFAPSSRNLSREFWRHFKTMYFDAQNALWLFNLLESVRVVFDISHDSIKPCSHFKECLEQ